MQMHRTVSLVSGASLGAGLIYFFDPEGPRRRRALGREKGHRLSGETGITARLGAPGQAGETGQSDGTASDMLSRTVGIGGAAKSWVQPTPPISDRTLVERVRTKLGQFSRHPSAIDVHATDGTVTVSGPVLEDEFDSVSNAIARIPGVAQIFNRLERHRTSDVPALQAAQERKSGPRSRQSNWSPTARTAAALMGTAAMLYGARRRTAGAATVAASGLGLFVRSMTNQEFGKLLNFRIGSFSQT